MRLIKYALLACIILLLGSCSFNKKKTTTYSLTELSYPHEIITDDEHLIISDGTEGTELFIYNLDDLSLYSSFGGNMVDGDTIGKFKVSGGHEVGMSIRNDTLLITDHWRASFYTKEGGFIKTHPINYDSYSYKFLGNGFQGTGYRKENNIGYFTFNLFDTDFKFIKEINKVASSSQEGGGIQVLTRKYQELNYNKYFYLKGLSDDFEVEIYDSNGALLNVIKRAYERIPMSEIYKNDVLNMYKEHPLFSQFYESIISRIEFPEFLPAIYNIKIADHYIYALTYEIEEDKSIIYKLNFDGKLIEKIAVPLVWRRAIEVFPYTIANGRIYQLIPDFEHWQVKVMSL